MAWHAVGPTTVDRNRSEDTHWTMIAAFYIETSAMEAAFDHASTMSASIVQQTTDGSGDLTVFLNATGGEFDAFESGLDTDPTVDEWVRFSEGEDRRQYRVTVTDRGQNLLTYPRWTADGAIFLKGNRHRDGWRFAIKFPTEASLQRYAEYCEGHEIEFQPRRVTRSSDPITSDHYGLTSVQSETLVTARKNGFFEVPRECTLTELSDSCEITHQALSERLRRGMGSLVESTLL